MIVIVVLVLASLGAGALASLLASRWPGADPASPRVAARIARWELREHPDFLRRRIDPRRATGLALTIALAVVGVGAAVFTAVTVMVAMATGLELADHPIERWVSAHGTAFGNDVLEAVTDLGSTVPVIVLTVIVAIVESVRVPSRAIVPFLLIVTAGESLVVIALKAIADRARPGINPVAENLGPSFPSGHTATAAACFVAVALVLSRRRPRRVQITLAGVSVGLAVAVATTRVLLGVHFLTDAVAGLAVGWVWVALCAIAFGGRLLRFGAPIELAERVDDLRHRVDEPEPLPEGPRSGAPASD